MPDPSRPKVSSPSPAAGGRPPTQAPTAPTGMPYGQAGKLKAAQAAVPLPGATPGTSPAPTGFVAALAAAQAHAPQDVGLRGGTTRPDEPVTAGLSRGPGVGPDPGMQQPGDDPTLAELRALYMRYPNPDLLELIEMGERGVTY